MNKAKQEIKQPFKMNLQLFADNQPTQPSQADLTAQAMQILQNQGGNSQPSQAAPTEQPQKGSNPQNSPQSQPNSGQPEGQQAPNNQAAPTAEQPNQAPPDANALILGKFKSPEELANAYANLEAMNTKTRQELAQQAQQSQATQAAMDQMKQQMNNVVNPQQAQQNQSTPEQDNEKFMNNFYENPTQSIQQMVQQMIEKSVMPQLQPMQQQYQQQQQKAQWDNAVSQFAQNTPDLEQFKSAMANVLQKDPTLNNHPDPMQALNIAYNMAKGQQYQDPNTLLQNQDFVNNNIMNNQDIKNQIIQQYLQDMKQNNQAPVVISGQANGATPVVPENKPQNMQEAKAMAMKLMQG